MPFSTVISMNRNFTILHCLLILLMIRQAEAQDIQVCGSSTSSQDLHEAFRNNKRVSVTANLRVPEELASERGHDDDDAAIANIVEKFTRTLQSNVPEQLQSPGESAGNADALTNPVRIVTKFDVIAAVTLDVNEAGLAALDRPSVKEQIQCVEIKRKEQLQLQVSVPMIKADVIGSDRGATKIIAILDSGIDATHPFFSGRIIREACFRKDGLCPNKKKQDFGRGAAQSKHWHGTHVAGIAAGSGLLENGKIEGVAPGAKLFPINIYSDGVEQEDQEAALNYLIKIIKTEKLPIAAVNISVGSQEAFPDFCDDEQVTRARLFRQLIALGVAPVVAAGNDGGHAAAISKPACISTAVAVSATDKLDNVLTNYNRSRATDLLAPGKDILSSLPMSSSLQRQLTDGYYADSGTSMAAPHVAGAFAVIREVVGDQIPVEDITAALRLSGVKVTDPITRRAYKRINVAAAIEMLQRTAFLNEQGPTTVLSAKQIEAAELQVGTPVLDLSGRKIAVIGQINGEAVAASKCGLEMQLEGGLKRSINVPCNFLIFDARQGSLISALSAASLRDLADEQR